MSILSVFITVLFICLVLYPLCILCLSLPVHCIRCLIMYILLLAAISGFPVK